MYYGQSPGVLSRIINQMYKVIYAQLHPLLHWDHRQLTVDKLKEYAQSIFENGGEQVWVAEGIFGFIDGTVCKIAHQCLIRKSSTVAGNDAIQSSFKALWPLMASLCTSLGHTRLSTMTCGCSTDHISKKPWIST